MPWQQPLPPAFAEAESSELRHRDYPRAIRLYKRLLARAKPAERPLLLHRLARTSRKAALLDEAFRYYGQLSQASSGRIGNLPADVVGKFELCSLWADQQASAKLKMGALEFYQGLVSGRWSLEKSRYLFYTDTARDWLARASAFPSEVLHLQETEQQKLALTLALEEFLETPRRVLPTETGAHLAFWQAEPFLALLLSESFVQEQFWPSIFTATMGSDLEVSVHASNGRVMFGAGPSSQETLAATRGLDQIGLPWRLEVRPRQLAALYQELNRRQNLYLAMSLLVLALLIFGSYLTARTVKRELEIARLKSEFVSAVSHEFRSPLTGIRQLGEMLMRGRWKSEQRRQEYYQMIVRESDRLTRLVENLLDFSRMEEGRLQYDLEPVEPTQWLQKLVEDFQSEVADQKMSIVASIPRELPVLSGDREALTCAVHNLLDNAVKYSGNSKTVWLHAEAKNSRLSIRVRDQGLGISQEDQKHIFEKFFRGEGEISRQVKGAGVGLSLVKHIVTTHGGSIEFKSLAGQGSTFSLHLPTQPQETG